MIRDVGSILKVGGTWIEGTLGNFLDVANSEKNGCLGRLDWLFSHVAHHGWATEKIL